ncbi:hypothetical protein OOK31_07255 [Streptomyces sp. NBC_00249]|uniref:hypothetical protein n=1 Tax=Streptomyces sp. NBC_00249 TaxID=2975690 RepID=UPI00224EBCF7|nr:hypothetical protein [Streptomyces sp. NBC_00249]MCX5193690.1 hypothetical protein [Streptomyces sp. NBC_00249]
MTARAPRRLARILGRRTRPAEPLADALTTVDLDTDGWLLSSATGRRVRADLLAGHLADRLNPPSWATDIIVHVHGWRTEPDSAVRGARRLLTLMARQRAARAALYPRLDEDRWAPWTVVVRWPSSSALTKGGYQEVRERAHDMSAEGTGYAPHVLGHLLGYLHAERGDPAAPGTLRTRAGQYLHLVGHSFGGRFLCEAVTAAADAAHGDTLGWSTATHPSRPFTVDSLTVFQMAAPASAFDSTFRRLRPGPLGHTSPVGGPMVFTHSRYDRATGFWHLLGEGRSGIGHSGMRVTSATTLAEAGALAPSDVWSTRLLRADTPYPLRSLDHTFVNVDASWRYRSTRINPVGAHSDFYHPESAHLLLSLAEHSRP